MLQRVMLLKHKNKIDMDGYLMLFLSVFVMFATAGMSYVFYFRKAYLFAKQAKTGCANNKMVCVLGKKLLNNKPDDEYILRLERARIILENDSGAEIMLLGGQTGMALVSEAYAGKEYLLNKNIEASRIHLEEKSRNTLENFSNAINLLNNKNKEIIVISNRYHLARASQLASGLGLCVEVCAAEERLNINSATIVKLLVEALHVHWYNVGRHYAHITKNNRIIERVG